MSLTENEWLTEIFDNRTAFSVRFSRKLFDAISDFQRVEIFETEPLGRVLILNGCFMVTEKDAFIYHEMLVHPAMQLLPDARNVLVIGGGDGGAVTELVKYPTLESVTLCEIDALVVRSCREFFPEVSAGLADLRVSVVTEDGARFVSNFVDEFDLVLVDSTDPVGPGKALFERPFYESVKRSLNGGGAAVFQTESPLFMPQVFSTAVGTLEDVFGPGTVHPYFATIPSYPGGLWSFTFCSERHDPIGGLSIGPAPMVRGTTRYYDTTIHRAAFALPVFVRESLRLRE